jgi:signal transduction histidine kinase
MQIAASPFLSSPVGAAEPERFPRSLRGRFTLALWILALLSLAVGLASVYALRAASGGAQQLAQERLTRLRQAQDIVQRALQIDRETDRLLAAPTLAATQERYASVVQQAAALDSAVQEMTRAGDNVEVLDLQQANQLFRNAVDVAAQLRENLLRTQDSLDRFLEESARRLESGPRADPTLANLFYRLQDADSPDVVERLKADFMRRRAPASGPAAGHARDPFAERLGLLRERAALQQCHDQLTRQSGAVVLAARQQSTSLDEDYRAAVEQLVGQSRRQQDRIVVLVAGSLLFTWLVSAVFRRHVLRRLQHVSHYLRLDGSAPVPLEALVHGRDEIGDMARAVDRFLADRAKLELRTTQLQETQDQLVKAARLAGIAEIATNILHNVGNVLNSVNVSADVIGATLRASKASGLSRAVRLMDEHEGDLAAFLARDPKGQLLHAYLRELGPALEAEQRSLATELETLCKSVDHIKNVVATQQSFAHAPRVVELLDLGDLVRDALRMCSPALARHKVAIVNDVGPLPALPLDSNRMLQILVNLISNAKQALDGVTDGSARVTLGADVEDDGGARILRVSVGDNGMGIAPENQARIFSHGFTTRKDGHGFGLHSCAVAAQEMGGTLTALSDGPGRGATFVLRVPITVQGTRP